MKEFLSILIDKVPKEFMEQALQVTNKEGKTVEQYAESKSQIRTLINGLLHPELVKESTMPPSTNTELLPLDDCIISPSIPICPDFPYNIEACHENVILAFENEVVQQLKKLSQSKLTRWTRCPHV